MRAVSKVAEGAVSLIAVMGFVLGFSIGSGPIPWVYLPEVLPNEIKGPAAALCTSLNWLSNLIVGLTFPAMLALLHVGGAYLVYAVSSLALFRFVGLKRRNYILVNQCAILGNGWFFPPSTREAVFISSPWHFLLGNL